MKIILKSIYLLIFILIAAIFIEVTSISTKYVNRSAITFDINNIRSPLIKKFVRSVDNIYSVFLLKISEKQKPIEWM